MFKYIKQINEYSDNRDRYTKFKTQELDFIEFQENKEFYNEYKKVKEGFDQYKKVIGDGTTPFFMMYASDIDQEGNITFNYDFNPDFIILLRQQGMQGINDLEVLESYLHLIFSQTYFTSMLTKEKEEDKTK